MNELKHYGILGMKWGIRRTPEQLGHKREKKEDFRRKDPKKMTDDELRRNLNRVQMEKQYEALTKKKKGEGAAFVKRALTTVGMMAVTSIAVDAIKGGKNALMNKASFIWNELGNIVIDKIN